MVDFEFDSWFDCYQLRRTKAQALEALEDMDDCARMNAGVDPHGPYNVLLRYIKQSAEPKSYFHRIRKAVHKFFLTLGDSK